MGAPCCPPPHPPKKSLPAPSKGYKMVPLQTCQFTIRSGLKTATLQKGTCIPSWELTYPLKTALLSRWFSFSPGGICWFPGGYITSWYRFAIFIIHPPVGLLGTSRAEHLRSWMASCYVSKGWVPCCWSHLYRSLDPWNFRRWTGGFGYNLPRNCGGSWGIWEVYEKKKQKGRILSMKSYSCFYKGSLMLCVCLWIPA